jgi:hypothetical protein
MEGSGERAPYSLHGRLSGPQSRSGRYGEEKNILVLPEIQPRLLARPARSLPAIQTDHVLYIYIFKFVVEYRNRKNSE